MCAHVRFTRVGAHGHVWWAASLYPRRALLRNYFCERRGGWEESGRRANREYNAEAIGVFLMIALILKQCLEGGKADSGLKVECSQCPLEALDCLSYHVALLKPSG